MGLSSSFLKCNWFIPGLMLHSSDESSRAVNQHLETFVCHLLKDRAEIHPHICKSILRLLDLMADVGPLPSCSALPQLSGTGLSPAQDVLSMANIWHKGSPYLPQQPHPIILRSLQHSYFYTPKTDQERTTYCFNLISRKSQMTLTLSEEPGTCSSCRFELSFCSFFPLNGNGSKLSNIISTLVLFLHF